ncbi:hypothetical protein PR202_ga07502 [Eleusine coracana subsp. coracana]|uniref:Uncharacterized protein n=1 Tax=Eleusine coracana subsp. coracana TaxID=191504 RepID=A0AAV5BXU5_ELECO|nr:hypothetical protein PR202_ga07502 [Eleusine coracana subsp. coracana]
MGSASAFLIRWINFFTMILALLVVGFGFWMSTHNDACRRSLTIPPKLSSATNLRCRSLVGFLGAWKNVSCLLWTYLIMLFVVLVAIMVFTVLAFIITNTGTGHAVPGARYIKEYRLQEYSSWFVKQACPVSLLKQILFPPLQFHVNVAMCWNILGNNLKLLPFKLYSSMTQKKWTRLRSCLVKSDDCNNMSKRYKSLKAIQARRPYSYGVWLLPPTCRVRPEPFTVYLKSATVNYNLICGISPFSLIIRCGYPAVNASYFDLSYHPVKHQRRLQIVTKTHALLGAMTAILAKLGSHKYMKEEWRVVAIFNVILFVILSFVYFVGCCARRNAGGSDTKARGR